MLENSSKPEPLAISPWIAMSLLQKAIRRGHRDLALRAASTLNDQAPHKLWRRLVAAAFEDVGLADLDACNAILRSALEVRLEPANNWQLAEKATSMLAGTYKCRASDDLLMGADNIPALAPARSYYAKRSYGELRADICTENDVYKQAIAIRYLLGTSRGPERTSIPVAGNPKVAFAALRGLGVHSDLVDLTEAAFRYTGSALPPLVALLSIRLIDAQTKIQDDPLPDTPDFKGIPLWAYDLYSREGRIALARFLTVRCDTADWINDHIKAQKIDFLGNLIFRVEGQRCGKRMRWQTADELRLAMDLECHGPDAFDLLKMTQRDLPLLHHVRLGSLLKENTTRDICYEL